MKRIKIIIWILILISLGLSQQQKPYLIMISIDGFRYDYLDRGITPNLNQLANEGVRAWSLQPSYPSKTFPNHYTIITGMYPEHHGLILNFMKNPFTGEIFSLGKRDAVTNPKWYGAEPLWTTAEKQGIKTACFFWPGSEVDASYRRPSYFKYYDKNIPYETRVDSILYWISLPEKKRPHLLFLYFEFVDTRGHQYGPNSPEVNDEIKRVDMAIGNLVHRLKKLDYYDKINIIILSDHGMQELRPEKERNIYLSKILPLDSVEVVGYGAISMIFPKNKTRINYYYHLLKEKQKHYRVYKREEVPDYLHFKHHPFIGPIVIIPDPGYEIESRPGRKKKWSTKGDHGYDNTVLSMHGLFIANGPAFKNHLKTSTLLNIDIYPLACKVLNIMPNQPIDGRLERIEFILKNDE